MAFKLVEDDSYTWPATINVPRDGKYVPVQLKPRFKYIGQDRINALVAPTSDEEQKDLLDEVLTGWEEFNDVKGEQIAYTDENRKQALNTPYIRAGLVQSFFASITGKQDARKNK